MFSVWKQFKMWTKFPVLTVLVLSLQKCSVDMSQTLNVMEESVHNDQLAVYDLVVAQ